LKHTALDRLQVRLNVILFSIVLYVGRVSYLINLSMRQYVLTTSGDIVGVFT